MRKQKAVRRRPTVWGLLFLMTLAVVPLALSACGSSSSSGTSSESSESTTAAGTATEAAATSEPQGKAVELGVVVPLTGPVGAAGKEALQGMEVAAEQVNEEGGIEGRPLKLAVEDSQGEVQPALEAASKLINVDKVPAVFGEYAANVSLPLGQYVTRHKVLFMTGSSGPELAGMSPLEFGFSALDTLTAKVAAEDLYEKGYRKLAGIFPNNSYGKYIANSLESSFKKLGGSVSSMVLYQEGQSDYRTELSRMQASEPDVYVYGSYGEDAATINKDAYELGLNETPWYGIYLSADIAEVDPVSTEGQTGIDQVISGSVGKDFTAAYEAANGEAPGAPFDAYAYDAVMTYAEAVATAGTTDPAKVAEAMLATERVGATGKISFNPEGQRKTAAFASVEAVDGKTKQIGIIEGEG